MAEIRALTVQQPWASAIAYGTKRVENRTWPTTFRGLLAIHAGKAVDWAADDPAWMAAGLAPYRAGGRRTAWSASLPLGAVVAVADLAGCHLHDAGGFGCGHDGRWSTTYDDLCADWAADWVVVGGESGPGHREMDVGWLVNLAGQCQDEGIPVWIKQDSGPRSGMQGRIPDDIWALKQFPGEVAARA